MTAIRFRSAMTLLLALLASVATAEVAVTYYRVSAYDFTAGPDGYLWLANGTGIMKMSPGGAKKTTYPVTGHSLTVGPDGRIWYGTDGGIGAITTDGVATLYPFPDGIIVRCLTAGGDGNLWFGSDTGVGKVTTAGVMTHYPITTPETRSVNDIQGGPDGNVWFIRYPLQRVERITPAGTVTHFDLGWDQYPSSIALGGDGNLWLGFQLRTDILRVTTDGTITPIYPLSAAIPYDQRPQNVFSGPDAWIWFTTGTSKIGRITADGGTELIDFKDTRSDITSSDFLAIGPDGNLWAQVNPICQCCIPECPPPTQVPIGLARLELNAPAVDIVPIPTASETVLGILAVALAALALIVLKQT